MDISSGKIIIVQTLIFHVLCEDLSRKKDLLPLQKEILEWDFKEFEEEHLDTLKTYNKAPWFNQDNMGKKMTSIIITDPRQPDET